MSGELNKLSIAGLLIILFVLLYNGYIKYQSNPIGTSVKFEKNTSLPYFSFCPWFYKKDFEIENINSESGHKVQDVMGSLPSMKDLIKAILKAEIGANIDSMSPLYLSPDLRQGMNNDVTDILKKDSWVESTKINEYAPFNLLRCLTIQWPEEVQLGMNSFVSIKYI